MRNLAILIYQTMGGVMQAPDRADEDLTGGFEHGGAGQRALITGRAK